MADEETPNEADAAAEDAAAEDAAEGAAAPEEPAAAEASDDAAPADEAPDGTDEASDADANADAEEADASPPESAPNDEPVAAADGVEASAPADDEVAPVDPTSAAPLERFEGDDSEEKEEHILPKDLPDPYCQRPWREMVGGLLVVAALVAGVTIYNHRSGGFDATNAGPATPGMVAGTMPAGPVPAGALPVVPAGVTPVALTTPLPPSSTAMQPRTAFNAAAHSARPSVVGIRALGTGAAGGPGFERIGSGVIVHSNGLVLTCTHVIAGASQVSVSRFGHAAERLPARLVATEGDLALLRVDAGVPMPVAHFANPDALSTGDWVLALGHPFGMGLSVSAGIVGRRNAELTLPGGVRQQGLVQTDASINEGLSGGPLVNLNGEIVGLNMAIFAPTGVFSGASFAIDGRRALDFVQRSMGAAAAMGPPTGMNPLAGQGPQVVPGNG